ncbi:ComEC/Rec2 family competence protein [Candidatus Collierbacteria bacterium]|nr:ComEC/Rec2 family competence protein [Candidatus Collierbacteria bacterium]
MKWRVLLLVVLMLVRVGFNSVNISQTISLKGVDNWRMKLVGVAARNLPEPEGALVLGVVLGYKSSLSREFYQSLINSGTVHMVVASGYNIMVVAGLALSGFLFFVSRGWASVLAIGVMIFYVILTGGEISVVRAALMGSMVFVGAVLGRGAKAWWSLALAVWLMLMIDPSIVGSISFQLSVAATFGVTVLAPYFKKRLEESGASLAGLVEKLDLTTSFSALILTWPIIWFHFGRGSLISLVSNAVILPLVPLLMAFGGLMLAGGALFGPMAMLISWPTYALAHLMVILVRLFGGPWP